MQDINENFLGKRLADDTGAARDGLAPETALVPFVPRGQHMLQPPLRCTESKKFAVDLDGEPKGMKLSNTLQKNANKKKFKGSDGATVATYLNSGSAASEVEECREK